MKGYKTGGRARGVPNIMTRTIRQMILEALDGAGGVAYLRKQAQENPQAFLTLLGKLLPREVSGPDGSPVTLDLRARKRES